MDRTDAYYKEELPNVGRFIKQKTKAICTLQGEGTVWETDFGMKLRVIVVSHKGMRTLKDYFRMASNFREISLLNSRASYLFEDCVAGLTVGLTAIPQGIAYAAVAGLQPKYGLYSAFMGCFVYIIFGSCKDVTVGPTAIMSLMIQSHVTQSPDFAILACFLMGCIITFFGILNLGFLVQFISMPVVAGFTTAAAITIASGQINALLGIPSSSNEFVPSWENFFKKISQTSLNDSLLGVITLIALLGLRKLKDIKGSAKKFGKYVSLSRNALAVIIGSTIAYFLTQDDYQPFRLTGDVESGLPNFQLPPFTTTVNGTHFDFQDMLSQLGSSIISLPLIAILESIAIAKAFSKGKTVRASQEMIALGICNLMGSFVQSIPVTGSFTRTAVNNSSGVRTTLGGAVTGCVVLLALGFLAKTFYYIPKASLAAIIISAMIFMIDYEKIFLTWKAKKIDIIPFLVTWLACLFLGLEYGILCGIVLNNLFVLFASARPKIEISLEKIDGFEVLLVTLTQNLVFSSAEYLKDRVIDTVASTTNKIDCIILEGSAVRTIDSTVAMNLIAMRGDLAVLKCNIIFWNWNKKAAGVLCRMDKKYQELFKNEITIEEIFHQRSYKTDVIIS